MISDVLHETVERLDRYLGDELYLAVYTGSTRLRLVRLRNQLERMRLELDSPPTPTPTAEWSDWWNACQRRRLPRGGGIVLMTAARKAWRDEVPPEEFAAECWARQRDEEEDDDDADAIQHCASCDIRLAELGREVSP